MGKRFHSTEIWDEDWFLELSIGHKLLWFYIKDNCNHFGVWKINKRLFEYVSSKKINLNDFLSDINKNKQRIIVLDDTKWYLTDFVRFQYGTILNLNNKVHESVFLGLTNYKLDTSCFEVKEKSIRPQKGVKQGAKDKDKVKDKEKVFIDELVFTNLVSTYNLNSLIEKEILNFFNHRKETKEPLTERAAKIILDNVSKWGNEFSQDEIIDTIQSSISSNWSGVFKPKKQTNLQRTNLPKQSALDRNTELMYQAHGQNNQG